MKVLIDIYEHQFEHCKRHAKENYANWLEEAVANGQPIPDDATNDDFFKAVLDEKGYRAIHDRFIGTKWLFAPYKGGK